MKVFVAFATQIDVFSTECKRVAKEGYLPNGPMRHDNGFWYQQWLKPETAQDEKFIEERKIVV